MKIYESIVIGNFLFALGFAVRARGKSDAITATAINLLQQSPADPLLGDLMMEFPGVVRLIEFKTIENRSPKERARHAVLSSRIIDYPHLESISRAVHWYIETSAKNDDLVATIAPYLDAFPVRRQGHKLEAFISSIADEVASPSEKFSRENVKSYLRWVQETQGDGKVGTGALLLVAEPNGKLHYAALSDLFELRLQHRNWIDYCEKRVLRELSQEQVQGRMNPKEQQIEEEQTRNLGRGMSR
jgi:hypothetical protein